MHKQKTMWWFSWSEKEDNINQHQKNYRKNSHELFETIAEVVSHHIRHTLAVIVPGF